MKVTEKKEPINLCSQCHLSNPTREQSTGKPGGTSLTKWLCFLHPIGVWLVKWYRLRCKNVTFLIIQATVIRRLPKKLLRRRSMKKKYMISCGSTSWVGRIPWRWKYGRHCAIDISLSFSIPARLLFSLHSQLTPFSAHLNAWNRSVLTLKIRH